MTDVQQRAAAKEFATYWKNRGNEKQKTQRFWIDLLRNVYDISNPEQSIEFEVPVKLSHTSFIDGYLADHRRGDSFRTLLRVYPASRKHL